jgi:hypothetical protein
MKNVNQKEADLQSFEACFSDRINPYFIRHGSAQFRTSRTVALRTFVVLQVG